MSDVVLLSLYISMSHYHSMYMIYVLGSLVFVLKYFSLETNWFFTSLISLVEFNPVVIKSRGLFTVLKNFFKKSALLSAVRTEIFTFCRETCYMSNIISRLVLSVSSVVISTTLSTKYVFWNISCKKRWFEI